VYQEESSCGIKTKTIKIRRSLSLTLHRIMSSTKAETALAAVDQSGAFKRVQNTSSPFFIYDYH
jgi:hypothetical protein